MFPILTQTIQRDSIITFPMLGDFSIDPPASFTVFGKEIYFYGVLIAFGFLLAIFWCSRSRNRFGIKEDDLYDTLLWLIPMAIIGARLYFVIFNNFDYYIHNPVKILAVWEGGLAIYGGVIAGVLVVILLCRKKKIPIGAMVDLLVFGLLIGQIIGRWGNFMNREAFGAETEIFCRMGLTSPAGTTIYVHPTFLYESLWNLALFIFLVVLVKKGKRQYDGECFFIYLFWYGIGRAWIEGLRSDSLYIGSTGIRVSQVLSIALALAGLVLLIIQRRKLHLPEELFVNRVAEAENKTVSEEESKTKNT